MNYYYWWIKLKPIPFILITTILNFIFMIPVIVVLSLINIEEKEIGGLNLDNYSPFDYYGGHNRSHFGNTSYPAASYKVY